MPEGLSGLCSVATRQRMLVPRGWVWCREMEYFNTDGCCLSEGISRHCSKAYLVVQVMCHSQTLNTSTLPYSLTHRHTRISDDAFKPADKPNVLFQSNGTLEIYAEFSPNACDVFSVPLTHLAATFFGASGGPAHSGVRVFHRQVFRRALEAGADHIAALGLRAQAPPTRPFGGVVDQNVTIRALEGVAVGRV